MEDHTNRTGRLMDADAKISVVQDALETQLQDEVPEGRIVSFVVSYHWQNLEEEGEGFVGGMRSGTIHEALGLMQELTHDYLGEFGDIE